MLKAIHAQEDKVSVLEKAKAVAKKLREMKLKVIFRTHKTIGSRTYTMDWCVLINLA